MEPRSLMKQLEKQRKRKGVPQSAYLTQMENPENVLEIRDLSTCFFTDAGVVRAVDGVSFDLPGGKTVAVVGESGCGKSATSLSVMQLLQRPQGQVVSGSIRLNLGDRVYDLAKTPESVLQSLRGSGMSMIFQEPMTALNPVFTVGAQVEEILTLHGRCRTNEERKGRALALLEAVGIPNTRGVYGMYPHNLSGGMRQRICIAMALACDPRLLIADEPTTALDVTIQAQILEVLRSVQEMSGCAILLITHDLGVVAQMADHVVVMYAGRVVEKGTVQEIFQSPAHPYTRGLMAAKPVVGRRTDRLYSIPGSVPNPIRLPRGCYFQQRCGDSGEMCRGEHPVMLTLSPTHQVSCFRAEEGKNGG